MNSQIGTEVGYQTRFDSKISNNTQLVYLTEGILINQIAEEIEQNYSQSVIAMKECNFIIVDEVHERSLNSDVILGQLKMLLQSRTDLKVILMSATLQSEQFLEYFKDQDPQLFEVEGTNHKVQIIYESPEREQEEILRQKQNEMQVYNYNQSILAKKIQIQQQENPDQREVYMQEFIRKMLSHEDKMINYEENQKQKKREKSDILQQIAKKAVDIHMGSRCGHILVFLSGEDEINQVHSLIHNYIELLKEQRKYKLSNFVHCYCVLPVYGNLAPEFQKKIFEEHLTKDGQVKRKIILATNIAETSLTIKDVVFVIDGGQVKQKGFDNKTKREFLFQQSITKANAIQRAGRAGRTEPGICYRMYSEEQFQNMEEFQLPEIQRSKLSTIILQLLKMKIQDVKNFPFINPPSQLQIEDAYKELSNLNAIKYEQNIWQLTKVGNEMGILPVDPRLAAILISARDEFGCLEELLAIVSMLSVSCNLVYQRKDNSEPLNYFIPKAFESTNGDMISLYQIYRDYRVIQRRSYQEQKEWGNKYNISTRYLSQAHKIFLIILRIMIYNKEDRDQIKNFDLPKEIPTNILYNIQRAFLRGLPDQIALKYKNSYFLFVDDMEVRFSRQSVYHQLQKQRIYAPDTIAYLDFLETDHNMMLSKCIEINKYIMNEMFPSIYNKDYLKSTSSFLEKRREEQQKMMTDHQPRDRINRVQNNQQQEVDVEETKQQQQVEVYGKDQNQQEDSSPVHYGRRGNRGQGNIRRRKYFDEVTPQDSERATAQFKILLENYEKIQQLQGSFDLDQEMKNLQMQKMDLTKKMSSREQRRGIQDN
uniref:DExD/H box RNA helicase 24 n=1 Tax=Philasterides dicentrarchi TaxID=282688 RepID=A0A481XUW3_9CILI|nr:DExD/H box RNA helicase 24 [Philasterides dicentrarchi]